MNVYREKRGRVSVWGQDQRQFWSCLDTDTVLWAAISDGHWWGAAEGRKELDFTTREKEAEQVGTDFRRAGRAEKYWG